MAMEDKIILSALKEQKEELNMYSSGTLCARKEEELFEWESKLAQVVTGVRRSGKSTLCHKVLMQKGVRYGYVNFDDDRLATIGVSELDAVLHCAYQVYGADIKYIFFDEIQNVDGWHIFVNRLLRQGMHVVLTGSNAKLLSGELATHLTGRYNEIKLYPFSFSEFLNLHNVHLTSGAAGVLTTRESANVRQLLLEYLNNGGLPEMYSINNESNKRTYVESLIETVISKDIAKRFKIRNADGLRRIAHYLMNNVCQEVNYKSLAEVAVLNSNMTAQKYTSYLSQAYLIHKVQKFSYKSMERICQEKAYSIDTGFIANRDNSLIGDNVGWKLENMVLVELLRRHKSESEDIYYYKPSTRSKEVDFVICRQSVVQQLVQVSLYITNGKTLKRETEALVEAAEKLKCDNLTILTLDESSVIESAGRTIHVTNVIEWLM